MFPKQSLSCPTHHSSFTNFCLTDSCVLPLCPACIRQHNLFHDKQHTKSNIVMFQEAVTKIQQQRVQKTEEMRGKLKANLGMIRRHPEEIRRTVGEAKRLAVAELELLFGKLQTSLLKQYEKQSYKSVSQLSKLITSVQQFLSKFSTNNDLQTNIELFKIYRQRDSNLRKSEASIFQSQTQFSLEKLGINEFSYNTDSELCLREFVEKCLVKNRGKENECFAVAESIVKSPKIQVPMPTIFEIKESASRYYNEPKTQNQGQNQNYNEYSYSFSERIDKETSREGFKDFLDIRDSSNVQEEKEKEKRVGEQSRGYQSLLPTGDLKFPILDFTPGFSLMNRE